MKVKVPPCKGERYESEVPDTLDLADRARLAINALTGMVDVERDHEIYFTTRFDVNPPYMYHDTTAMPTNNPKFAESLPMMRIMSGSNQNLDIEAGITQIMIDQTEDDGLYYVKAKKERPWHEGVSHNIYPIWKEDFANVYGNSRYMLAMMAWYQRDRDPAWLDRIKKVADGLAKIAVYKDDYAYYPDSSVGEAFSYTRSGWKVTTEPRWERWGAEGSTFMYHCGEIRALADWYAMSGDKKALELAQKLTNFVMKPRFWGVETDPKGIASHEHAHFTGHYHAHIATFRGLLEYAVAANDSYLMEFVREGYEYARNFGLSRIGCFGEGCSVADMVAFAIRLSDYGVGDYWEDVDQYVRNQLAEQQLVDAELMKKAAEAGQPHEVKPPQETSDQATERTIGAFAVNGEPTILPNPWSLCCCTGNGTQALYYAWESIVRCKDNVAQVNLLLNRASPWLDIDSYQPYEGKVVIKNKTAKKILVRIPRWVNKKDVQSNVNGKAISAFWFGNYLVFDKIGKGDTVTVEFPMVETKEKYTVGGKEYTCQFKGNTLVDISPRETKLGYPIYLREQYKKDKAPTKKVERYVSPIMINW